MGTRSRTLKYLPGHQLRFGIAAVSRDPATGDVEEAVCLFCKHFGREQRADKKRKSASTVKYFRDSFRPDQYTQHHQLQHPTQWTKYKDASDGEKHSFFPLMKTEERGRCFDVKASIVEVVAVLAVGLGPVEPTVQTRDRLVTPVAFGQEIDMLVAHSGFLQEHLKEVAFSSETALKIPVSWWVGLQVLQWVTARANAVFEVLEKQHVTISQQATVMASLAEECITGFHAQIHENRSSVSQTGSIEYISLDKRVSLSKTNLVEFVISSSELARDMGKHGGGATVNAASEHFAMGAVNMIASLVELSVSLKQQCAACSNVSGRVSQTTVVADVLPPVMPHELVQLNSDEFDELLEAHDTSSRGTLKDDDIKAEHELLCCTFAKDGDLRIALEMCTQGTPFDVAWSLMDARFKSLEAFAGGLATVCPSNVVPLSATSARDLVLCPKDMEEARLLLADFELESALHAQQFQSLTKLQEEIYDREVAERRVRKRHKTINST
ncbi:hypothetical protein PC129_g2080 [Phytophthora cactorum]|uniref:Uncharacterized protein n=1 Tax=Phytophthora cactorum TaxID=29920 RepID=A0A329SMX4_9STRA|nr:hypothetical protein Pcac1_g14783 [Phytophthora cactorum]KAG2865470.1 hypothetical protein PC113_g3657 [Phytophthora cactorum]KAG2939449.1 hypothetical protein PC115_g3071 [Phytophthora cactorum]KAG3179517.1 hypothetical protein PC128_g15896 [Phytophthora cactorum]KAG3227365.1 hypothetical protein PC129_g2080 [Phytophthora cactorum]